MIWVAIRCLAARPRCHVAGQPAGIPAACLPARTEEARFERAVGEAAHGGLAIRCLKPLGHSSSMERRGFEPLKPSRASGLQPGAITILPTLPVRETQAFSESSLPGWDRTSDLYLPGIAPSRLATGRNDPIGIVPRPLLEPEYSGGRTRTSNLHVQSVMAYHWPTPEYNRLFWQGRKRSVRESNSRFALEGGTACH